TGARQRLQSFRVRAVRRLQSAGARRTRERENRGRQSRKGHARFRASAATYGADATASRACRERRSAMSETNPTTTWRERLASPLTWHMAGFFLLLVLAVALAIRLGLDWAVMDSHSTQVLASKQIQLKALEIQTTPLRGLDQRVEKTREQLDDLYRRRVPPNYSSIDARSDELQVASGVRLTRVQYTQGEPGPGLTEITMDASISGNYPAIMRFVNSMERDP